MLLTPNQFSRPGKKLESVKGIVIHWVANAGSSAIANRNYFENLKSQPPGKPDARFASAHFIVCIDGGIVQCLPTNEMAYHVGAKLYKPEAVTAFGHFPNNCTIGIELCHPDDSGKFADATLRSARELARELCGQFLLSPTENIWRHYDMGMPGKICPKWFVEHPVEFDAFKQSIVFME